VRENADHIKNLDWSAREAVFIEKAPDELIDEVLAKIDALIF
jgi:mRNA interferase MazF